MRMVALALGLGLTGAWGGDFLVTGRVVDGAGRPMAGAYVRLAKAGKGTGADSAGYFALTASSPQAGLRPALARAAVEFDGPVLRLPYLDGKGWTAEVFDPRGRRTAIHHSSGGELRWFGADIPADGLYLARLTAPGLALSNRCLVVDGRAGWSRRRLGLAEGRGALAKAAAAAFDTVVAGFPGYAEAAQAVAADTALGLLLRLSAGAPAGQVAVIETTLTLNFSYPGAEKALSTDDGLFASGSYNKGKGYGYLQNGSNATATLGGVKAVILDNGLVRVAVSPTLGMRVLWATDLATGKPFFHVDDPVTAGRVWDVGGVEGEWPFFEHGTHIFNRDTDPARGFQSAGYYIRRESDGSVTVAMDMRFEQNRDSADAALQGKYSDRPFSGWLTVAPGSALFTLSYRADNPNPTPRSDRLWSDALFPKGGSEDNVPLFPTRWASYHFTNYAWDLSGLQGKPTSAWYDGNKAYSGDVRRSLFALHSPYPFCGMYYPADTLNRLRVTDPAKYPGMKLFFDKGLDFVEFWGSTGVVFEEPGHLLPGYQPTDLTESYYLAPGIGKADYANGSVAIAVDTAAHAFKLTGPAHARVRVEGFDGQALAQGEIGPGLPPLSGKCPANQVVVRTEAGAELMRQSFPLPLPDNFDTFKPLRASAAQSFYGSGASARLNDSANIGTVLTQKRGLHFELEGTQNNTDGLRDWQALKANVAPTDSPAFQLSVARAVYRYRRFTRALQLCDQAEAAPGAAARDSADAAYLRGLIAWERKAPADSLRPLFAQAGAQGGYHLALLDLGAGDAAAAESSLVRYLASYPKGYRPALLLAWLRKDLGAASRLAGDDPGSLEAQWVLKSLGAPGAAEALQGLLTDNPAADLAVARWEAETKGVWAPVTRWDLFPAGWGTPDPL